MDIICKCMKNRSIHRDCPDSGLMIALTATIDAIGSHHFPARIAEMLLQTSHFDNMLICAFFKNHKPCQIFCDLGEQAIQLTVTPYLQYAYLLDPFYDVFKRGVGDQVMRLKECAPDNFRATEYYKTFYLNTGLLDEYAIFVDFGNSASIIFFLGKNVTKTDSDSHHKYTDTKRKLNTLLPVIAALCHRHWSQLSPSSLAGGGRLKSHLEKNFALFGSSKLSPRETEIVKLILKGHSGKSMARILGNSPETVKVQRKSIYAKMNIASQGELFALFLDALSQTPPNATGDPLNYLHCLHGQADG